MVWMDWIVGFDRFDGLSDSIDGNRLRCVGLALAASRSSAVVVVDAQRWRVVFGRSC